MDAAALLGLLVAWGAVAGAVAAQGADPGDFALAGPAVIVLAGTLGATAASVSLGHVLRLPGYVRLALSGGGTDRAALIADLAAMARQARRSGILGLEELHDRVADPLTRRGLELVIDGASPELVREVMETEAHTLLERYRSGVQVLTSAWSLRAGDGRHRHGHRIIQMLQAHTAPAQMASAVASAFVATLYGACLANLLFLPLASRLRLKSETEAETFEMVTEGVLAIQAGLSPRLVETRALAFLPARKREAYTRLAETQARTGARRAA